MHGSSARFETRKPPNSAFCVLQHIRRDRMTESFEELIGPVIIEVLDFDDLKVMA
jgi:hypothetical protein